jgi:hypothetical protein
MRLTGLLFLGVSGALACGGKGAGPTAIQPGPSDASSGAADAGIPADRDGTSADGPAGDESPQPPEAFVAAYVQAGANAAQCPFGTQTAWVEVGVPTGMQPTTVADGHQQMGSNVTVHCSVHPSGGGFDVQLNASLQGQGTLTINSPAGQGAVTLSGGGAGITGTFENANLGANPFASQDCIITFMYDGAGIPVTPPIAAGRIWGHISCPAAQKTGQTVQLPDGGMQFQTCDAEADFLFQFCGE